jgi:hypothetical protein
MAGAAFMGLFAGVTIKEMRKKTDAYRAAMSNAVEQMTRWDCYDNGPKEFIAARDQMRALLGEENL